MPGKGAPADLLEHVFGRTGVPDPALRHGPAVGEDAAAIDLDAALETEPADGTSNESDGPALVVSSDPISLAASDVGTLGVHVACNDVAASGVDPRWLTVVAVLSERSELGPISRDVDAAARQVGATVVGGHTEYDETRSRPFLSLTAMGLGEFVPTGGAKPGDRILLTKGAGIEGTAILAADFGDELDVDGGTLSRAVDLLEEVSVVPDARALRDRANSMHDPTEGGVRAGLLELALASDVRLVVDREAVPVHEETRTLCDAADVDPLSIFGSGALLATVPPESVDLAERALDSLGVEVADIGAVREPDDRAGLELDGEWTSDPGAVEDDLYPLWAAVDAEE